MVPKTSCTDTQTKYENITIYSTDKNIFQIEQNLLNFYSLSPQKNFTHTHTHIPITKRTILSKMHKRYLLVRKNESEVKNYQINFED